MWSLLPPLLAAALAPGVPSPNPDLVDLLRATREPGWPGAPAVQAQVTAAVLEDVDGAIALLGERSVPARTDEEEDQILSVVQRDLVLDGLEQAEGSVVRTAATHHEADGRARGEAPTVALWLLAAGGQASDAAQAVRWVDRALEEGRDARDLRAAARLCVARIARRDPSCYGWLSPALVEAERETLMGVLPGMGDAGDPTGLDCLMDLVRQREDVHDLAVGQVRRLGRSLDPRTNERTAGVLRTLLGAERSTTREEAARALAVLGDADSVPALLELLGSEDHGQRDAARWALETLAGREAGADLETWTTWYERELEWRDHRMRMLEVDLASRDSAEQARAILSLSRRELFVDDWARVLVEVQPASPQVRALVCRALGELGSVEAVPFLLETSGEGSKELLETCRVALEAIVGRPLPAEPADWPQALRDQPRS